ncbi:MAG: hypothetical protein M3155_00830 [Actinomycetota bacterium]|nr:hypothetical protein [Actinomycetota bacterium]
MRHNTNSRHAVRRVVLPSGKTIEIVYFADEADTGAPAGPASPAPPREGELHLCPTCDSALVYPTDWEQAGETEWALTLRCPNCEWVGEGTFEQGAVEQLDVELDNGTQVLVRDLRQLMHANMEEEVERFAAALHGGHIWPMDF